MTGKVGTKEWDGARDPHSYGIGPGAGQHAVAIRHSTPLCPDRTARSRHRGRHTLHVWGLAMLTQSWLGSSPQQHEAAIPVSTFVCFTVYCVASP